MTIVKLKESNHQTDSDKGALRQLTTSYCLQLRPLTRSGIIEVCSVVSFESLKQPHNQDYRVAGCVITEKGETDSIAEHCSE